MPYQFTDPNQDDNWTAFQAYKQRQQQFNDQTTAQNAQSVAALAAYYPTMQPGVALALGRAGIKPGEALAEQANQNAAQANAQKAKDKPWYKDLFNATVRGASTVAQFPVQLTMGGARSLGGAIQKHGWVGALNPANVFSGDPTYDVTSQTDIGQIVNKATEQGGAIQRYGVLGALNPANTLNQLQNANIDTGSGFFTNPTSGIGQAQAAAARKAWTVDGHAATLGRLGAGVFLSPDTHAYNVVSGAIDAAASWKLDPTNVAGAEFAELSKAKKSFAPIDAGVFTTHRPVVARDIAQNWLDSNVGRQLSDRLAETTSPTDIRLRTKGKIDVETSVQLADAKTPEEVRQVFLDNLDKLKDKPYVDGLKAWQPVKSQLGNVGYRVRKATDSVRFLQSTPSGGFNLSDIDQSVESLDRTLKNANFKSADAAEWTDKLARAADPEARRTVIFDALSHIAQRITPDKLPADPMKAAMVQGAAKKSVQLFKNSSDSFRAYNVQEMGRETGIEGLTIGNKGETLAQPVLVSQLSNNTLPGLSREQAVEIRRQTSKLAPILTNNAYKVPASVLGAIGSKWRDAQLIRGAYTVRAIGEEQLRLASRGFNSVASHPLTAIAYMVGDHNPSVFGKEIPVDSFVGKLGKKPLGVTDIHGNTWADQASAEGATVNAWAQVHMQTHGSKRWAMNNVLDGYGPAISKGTEHFVPGWSGELRQFHADPVMKRLAGGWEETDGVKLTGNDVSDVKNWFWDGKGSEFRKLHAARGGRWANLADDRELSDTYVDGINQLLTHKTGADPEVKNLVAFGSLGRPGSNAVQTKSEIESFLQNKADSGVGPDIVRSHLSVVGPEKTGRYRQATNYAFDHLMAYPSNYLSRSNAFRQNYWDRVIDHAPNLNTSDQQKLLSAAESSGLDGGRMGKLKAQMSRGKTGELDYENLDTLAKAQSLEQVKKLLYDLSESNQFFDMAKVVFPFGDAWREVMTTWAKTFKENPQQINRAKQIVSGGENSGFFYEDENGREVFNYPLSQGVNAMISGIPVPFRGSAEGLNLIGNGLPGVGPVVQAGAGWLAKNEPSIPDWMRKLALPNGNIDESNGLLEAFFPGWAKKLLDARANPNTNNRLHTAFGRIAQYKISTGQYDISTEDGIDKLEKDSLATARRLMVFNGLASSVLPTAPSPEWVAKDKYGQLTTISKMLDDYRGLQKLDYEHATELFLQQYGEDALGVMQPLSEGGFGPTQELHQWVQAHPDVASQYKDVYGYFAGDGGDYSSIEYERQAAAGERSLLKPRQIVELANARVATMQYAQARDLMGPKPNDAQREFLRTVQDALMQKYPGYSPGTFSGKSVDYKITELQRLIENHPEMASSSAGKAAAQYMEIRAAVAAASPGFATAKQAAGLRGLLRTQGDALSASNPEFSRMWVDLFQRELKEDQVPNGQ